MGDVRENIPYLIKVTVSDIGGQSAIDGRVCLIQFIMAVAKFFIIGFN